VICGLIFALAAWWKLPETHPPEARIPFSTRNLLATSATVLRHREFLLLALATALNFCTIAVMIGAAPAIVEKHWGMGETSYAALFAPVIAGILVGAWFSGRIAGRLDVVLQVRIGIATTFAVALVRVILHLLFDAVPVPLQQALLFTAGVGAQLAFPVLTLRMLDLFPAARGTAASAQSFVALLFTAITFGVISPLSLAQLPWLAWSSFGIACAAAGCWQLSLRAHARRPLAAAG
jgi:DHA1 family bicyclomycin/chloramphenicol resistance-like MFS transporter